MRLPASFRDTSIRRKLMFIAFLAAVTAMLFVMLAVTVQQWFMLRDDLAKNVYAQASIVATNSMSALVFNDREAAEQTLGALAAIDNVEYAGLLDKTGKELAVYVRTGLVMVPHQHKAEERESNSFNMKYLDVVTPIVFKQERIGTIHVRSNLAPVYDKLAWSMLVIVVAATGALLVAVMMLLRLLPAITDPLHYLVGLMNTVSRDNNYTLRAKLRSKDELGTLAQGFNNMLAQIQARDAELEQHRAYLEQEVAQRTEQLLAAQDELVRKEKMAMLGQVAGSVGHELRNPLGVMSNAVYYLQTVLEGGDDSAKEYLGIILAEITRSEHIVDELLAAVLTRTPDVATHGVAELVGQILRQCVVPDSVTVTLDIPATIPPLRVDALQMQQVLRNLISNSVEAMVEGGTLAINAVENRQKGTVRLSVHDSGSGMTPEVMAQLFQPLFTTKSRGIGLGLVVAKNLTEANGGHIEVQSEVGLGTTFSIILPGDYQEENHHG
jgi:signal transduction histidine kinase